MEIACRSCGEKIQVQSLLAAARQPCSQCGQMLMGDMGPVNLDDIPPPPKRTSSAADATHFKPRPKNAFWQGLIIGALIGVVLVTIYTLSSAKLAPADRGTVFGCLAGVILAPFIPLLVYSSMSWDMRLITETGPTSLYSLLGVVGLIPVGMIIGGYLGSQVETVDLSLMILGFMGAATFAALLGAFSGLFIIVQPDNPEKETAEA